VIQILAELFISCYSIFGVCWTKLCENVDIKYGMACSALILLIRQQEGHLTCKKLSGGWVSVVICLR